MIRQNYHDLSVRIPGYGQFFYAIKFLLRKKIDVDKGGDIRFEGELLPDSKFRMKS